MHVEIKCSRFARGKACGQNAWSSLTSRLPVCMSLSVRLSVSGSLFESSYFSASSSCSLRNSSLAVFCFEAGRRNVGGVHGNFRIPTLWLRSGQMTNRPTARTRCPPAREDRERDGGHSLRKLDHWNGITYPRIWWAYTWLSMWLSCSFIILGFKDYTDIRRSTIIKILLSSIMRSIINII